MLRMNLLSTIHGPTCATACAQCVACASELCIIYAVCVDHYNSAGFKKALLHNPRETNREQTFSEMIRAYRPKVGVTAPKVRVTAGETALIRTKSARKGTRMGFFSLLQRTP